MGRDGPSHLRQHSPRQQGQLGPRACWHLLKSKLRFGQSLVLGHRGSWWVVTLFLPVLVFFLGLSSSSKSPQQTSVLALPGNLRASTTGSCYLLSSPEVTGPRKCPERGGELSCLEQTAVTSVSLTVECHQGKDSGTTLPPAKSGLLHQGFWLQWMQAVRQILESFSCGQSMLSYFSSWFGGHLCLPPF